MTPTHRASLAALNAYQTADAAKRAAQITDDVTWLLDAGTHPEQVAARLGMTLAALERYLDRHDRHDLARPFSRIRDRAATATEGRRVNGYHQTLATYLQERDPTWMDAAWCAGADPELWFPLGGSGAEAKRICSECPVTTECVDYAIRTRQSDGIWGGLNADERREIARRRRAKRRAS